MSRTAMSRTERREFFIGTVTALVIVAVFAMTAMANRRAQDNPALFHLSADFARVDGVHVGSPVRVSGVAVGSVASMKLDPHFRAVVTMQLTRPIDLPDDSSALIQTDGVFGAKFIELTPGGSDTLLKPGGRISYSQDSVIIESLIERIVNQAKANRKTAAAQGSASP
jgi:phospholipid/cholesterol/gamma-HCH transport system substrate-binding protein